MLNIAINSEIFKLKFLIPTKYATLGISFLRSLMSTSAISGIFFVDKLIDFVKTTLNFSTQKNEYFSEILSILV